MLTPRRKSDTYHHGDLKDSAISVGLKLVQGHGIHALGIRKVAEKLSVTPAALYRHFENIEALKLEISSHVSAQLAEEMVAKRNRVSKNSSKKEFAGKRFYAIGEAYLDFARKEPKLFEIAFYCLTNPEIWADDNTEDQSWKVLDEGISELCDAGLLRRESQEDFGRFAWSAVHGLATLVSQGFIHENDYPKFKKDVLGGVKASMKSM
jgi:AcrR family transcriptional regulator